MNGFSLLPLTFSFVFQRPRTPSLEEIFEKIKEAVHKNGIRTTEFFRDHDKLRSGEITESQARNLMVYFDSQINWFLLTELINKLPP